MRFWAVGFVGLLGAGTIALAQEPLALGGQFQVNSFTTYLQGFPSVSSVDSRGSFVVVWHSEGSKGTDSSDFSVQGQSFATTIFADGFESGDSSRWSSTKQ